MKILLLGSQSPNLKPYILDEYIHHTNEVITTEFAKDFDFIISYGYRHILKKDILDLFPFRAINLHISFLPWNRGADPNYWSIVENTPKGVTIHYMDEGLDTGDIIDQVEVEFDDHDTFATSYSKLHKEITNLFKKQWPYIKLGKCNRIKQKGKGSYHNSKDAPKIDYNQKINLST
jgi:methionyl-tRNA formyltransferase